jgi:hypothetical protein
MRAEVMIDATPEAVFDSMTQSDQFCKWFGANVDIEAYVGGRFAMGGFELDPGGARFVEFEPGRKATLRFADGITSSWELEGSDGKTRLTLVQSGFDPTNPPYPGWAGWLGGISALRRYHELPRSRSIWRQIEAGLCPGAPFTRGGVDNPHQVDRPARASAWRCRRVAASFSYESEPMIGQ